jgi:hypothetical protein
VVLEFVGVDPQLPDNISSLEPNVQKLNCSLALVAVRAWLWREAGTVLTNENAITGIRSFPWPGRFQTIAEESFEWYLDGAHTEASIKHAVGWYANNLDRQQRWDSKCRLFQPYSLMLVTVKGLCLTFSYSVTSPKEMAWDFSVTPQRPYEKGASSSSM